MTHQWRRNQAPTSPLPQAAARSGESRTQQCGAAFISSPSINPPPLPLTPHSFFYPSREASSSPSLYLPEGGGGEDLGLEDLDSDSEGEEGDTPTLSRVCLLSRYRMAYVCQSCATVHTHMHMHTHPHARHHRQYFHIWSSRSSHAYLLLPPAPRVDWHGGHRRPPLCDPDTQQQSAYYRKWSKPADKEVKTLLDGLSKEASRGSRRRYLLTGPPQVCVCVCVGGGGGGGQ